MENGKTQKVLETIVQLHSHSQRFFANVSLKYEPVHEISNNVVCATSKASDQPAHKRSLIRAFASRLINL